MPGSKSKLDPREAVTTLRTFLHQRKWKGKAVWGHRVRPAVVSTVADCAAVFGPARSQNGTKARALVVSHHRDTM